MGLTMLMALCRKGLIECSVYGAAWDGVSLPAIFPPFRSGEIRCPISLPYQTVARLEINGWLCTLLVAYATMTIGENYDSWHMFHQPGESEDIMKSTIITQGIVMGFNTIQVKTNILSSLIDQEVTVIVMRSEHTDGVKGLPDLKEWGLDQIVFASRKGGKCVDKP